MRGLGRALGAVADLRWSAPQDAADVRPVTLVTSTPPGSPSARRLAISLARVEARELGVNPWFRVGLGFCAVIVLAFGVSGSVTGSWADVVESLPFLAHPLVGMAVLAAHRAMTRARRDGAEELFDACPAAPVPRTIGVLGAAWVPVGVLAMFFTAYLASVYASGADVHGPFGSAAAPTLLAGLVLGAGGVVLGVALGRWATFSAAPLVAVVLIGFVSIQLAAGDPDRFRATMVFSTMLPLGDNPVDLTAAQAWWHLGWLVALTAVTGFVAIAGPRRELIR
jgi:hypothetical protein